MHITAAPTALGHDLRRPMHRNNLYAIHHLAPRTRLMTVFPNDPAETDRQYHAHEQQDSPRILAQLVGRFRVGWLRM